MLITAGSLTASTVPSRLMNKLIPCPRSLRTLRSGQSHPLQTSGNQASKREVGEPRKTQAELVPFFMHTESQQALLPDLVPGPYLTEASRAISESQSLGWEVSPKPPTAKQLPQMGLEERRHMIMT